LGNLAISANGQRDTSNSFTINGVSGSNIFKRQIHKSGDSGRVAVNIGEGGNGQSNRSGEIVTSTSVYGAIGQALPSPLPETIEELHFNSSMYDASQGANSEPYEYHQSTGWNASQWFYNHFELPRPHMNRNVFGGYLGGPIMKDKLFYFVSSQGQRVADQLLGTSLDQ
jgi:hypothetical protein